MPNQGVHPLMIPASNYTQLLISSCDEIGNWAGNPEPVELDTETKYSGAASVKQDVPDTCPTFHCRSMQWTQSLDARSWSYLNFRHRCTQPASALMQSRAYIVDAAGRYYGWEYLYDADTWQLVSLDMQHPHYVSDPPPDLGSIAFISIEHTPGDAPPFTAWVDELSAIVEAPGLAQQVMLVMVLVMGVTLAMSMMEEV